MSIITKKTLVPGQPGTKKWIEKYGDALTCVRYKYDSVNNKKIKTVELIVDEQPWKADEERMPANKIIRVKVKYGEAHIGRLVKAAGGKWNRKIQLWELPYGEAIALGLEKRIVKTK